jgi:hypothetical protein
MMINTTPIILSKNDKKILKILLSPNSKIQFHIASDDSDKLIAKKLTIPVVDVKLCRKKLEENFLKILYVMTLVSLGRRRVDFFISTTKGLTIPISKNLMRLQNVVSVGRSIGEPKIDLRVELIVKDNGQLLELLEQVKGMKGVQDVVWSEIVQVLGDKGSVPSAVIDVL